MFKLIVLLLVGMMASPAEALYWRRELSRVERQRLGPQDVHEFARVLNVRADSPLSEVEAQYHGIRAAFEVSLHNRPSLTVQHRLQEAMKRIEFSYEAMKFAHANDLDIQKSVWRSHAYREIIFFDKVFAVIHLRHSFRFIHGEYVFESRHTSQSTSEEVLDRSEQMFSNLQVAFRRELCQSLME